MEQINDGDRDYPRAYEDFVATSIIRKVIFSFFFQYR